MEYSSVRGKNQFSRGDIEYSLHKKINYDRKSAASQTDVRVFAVAPSTCIYRGQYMSDPLVAHVLPTRKSKDKEVKKIRNTGIYRKY